MSQEFMDWLELVRVKADIPFFITSGFRCQEHNSNVEGAAHSAHLRGAAVDIKVNGGGQRHIIVKAALSLGAYGVGVAQGFVHLDRDLVVPRPMLWSY
jgi:uncharacterized protein YcbK (DUF882 family)